MGMLFCCTLLTNAQTNSIVSTISPPASRNINISSTDKPIEGHLYEFNYTLDFARELGFAKIVNIIEEEDYKKAFSEMDKSVIIGHDRQLTNGYKAGFFIESLKGICKEQSGEVIKAYRAYQNARYYCEEDKALQWPAPKLEVWTGIGRIFDQVGRHYDALNYLDAARMEAAEYKTVAIAADNALIKHYIRVGDHKAACEMFEDLGTQIKLSRDQYNGYARLLFELGKDREAFAQLLNGIAKYGFDEDLGIKDPMLNLFLNALPRANDEEIKWYYDLNGYWIEEARAEKRDKGYIMMLLKTRLLFSKVLPFIYSEDDIKKLNKRVQYLKTNMVYNVAERYIKSKYDHSYSLITQKEIKIPAISTNDLISLSLEAQLEDLLTKGYICLGTTRTWKEAYKHYSRFAELCTNENLKAVCYDDTTFEAFYDFIPCITSACGLAFNPDMTKIPEILEKVSKTNCDFSRYLSSIKIPL